MEWTCATFLPTWWQHFICFRFSATQVFFLRYVRRAALLPPQLLFQSVSVHLSIWPNTDVFIQLSGNICSRSKSLCKECKCQSAEMPLQAMVFRHMFTSLQMFVMRRDMEKRQDLLTLKYMWSAVLPGRSKKNQTLQTCMKHSDDVVSVYSINLIFISDN